MREGQDFQPNERDALIDAARQGQQSAPGTGRRPPSALKLARNFTKAVIRHVGDSLKKVDLPVYTSRINTCNPCPLRVNTRCTHESCGCFLNKKAWWASEKCPLDKW